MHDKLMSHRNLVNATLKCWKHALNSTIITDNIALGLLIIILAFIIINLSRTDCFEIRDIIKFKASNLLNL